MSNFLARLVERQWGRIPTVEPRAQSMFEPVADAPSFQVVDAVALQPRADWRQDPDEHHAAPEAKQRDQDPVQQQSLERWISPSEPLVHQTIAPPMVRPLLGSTAPAEATTDVERQPPSSRLSAPPMPIHPALDASAGVQPVPKQGQAAKPRDTADAHSFTETTLIPAPPLVGPRAQDPIPAKSEQFDYGRSGDVVDVYRLREP